MLVLGLGVYLFVEVRAQPAPPLVPRGRASPRAIAPEPPDREPPDPELRPAAVAGSPAAVARPAPPLHPPGEPSSATPHDIAAGSAQDDLVPPGPKLDAVMGEANKAYDRGDYEDAKQVAARVLAKYPANVRMLRIMVSASCIDGDGVVAFAHFARLPPADQEQMRVRCSRYGMAFPDPP